MLALFLFIVFAAWPVLGQLVIALVNRHYRRRGHAAPIPATVEGGEILMRMYLWPAVLWRYLRHPG
jgi:hypothetical protein